MSGKCEQWRPFSENCNIFSNYKSSRKKETTCRQLIFYQLMHQTKRTSLIPSHIKTLSIVDICLTLLMHLKSVIFRLLFLSEQLNVI